MSSSLIVAPKSLVPSPAHECGVAESLGASEDVFLLGGRDACVDSNVLKDIVPAGPVFKMLHGRTGDADVWREICTKNKLCSPIRSEQSDRKWETHDGQCQINDEFVSNRSVMNA